MLVGLVGTNCVSHRSVCLSKCVVAASLRVARLLVQVGLPIVLLPLCVHDDREGR